MGEPTDAERAALEALEYTEEWLTAGLLDRALLAEQHARFQAGGSRKTGKYRTQALNAWLERDGPLDDEQVDVFLSLVAADPDAKLAQSAVAELIQSPRLGLDQLERIARSDPERMRRHEALIRRTWLARRIQEGVTDPLLEQVIEGRDAAIQNGLIRDPRLTRKQAEQLARRGANPTIRDNAQAWVQDKKAWK